MQLTTSNWVIQGQVFPDDVVGPLTEVVWPDDRVELRLRFEKRTFPSFVARRLTLPQSSPRAKKSSQLIEVDEIKSPAMDGIATGTSRR